MRHHFDISIIIVNYNVRHFIVECLESYRRSKHEGLNIEIIVVDNASIDGSVEVIASQYPDVQLIANKDNVGFSTANNQGIKLSKGKYILLLNPDTLLEEDTLRICYEYMESHANVGALGVKMIDGAGKFLPESKRALPTAWNSITKLVGLSSVFSKSKLFNGYALGHLSPDEQHNIQVLCGAFMFMPRQVLDKVGLLDERFFMYGEDIDLSFRIIKGGYEIHYIPDTTIIHYKGESTKKGSLNYVKTFYNAMGLYVDKHYDSGQAAVFGKFLKVGIWARASISATKRLVFNLFPKLLDGLLLFGGLFAFSKTWARYYFEDNSYYEGGPLLWNIGLYSTIWIVAAWLIGYYKKSTWEKRIQAVLIGLVAILGIYGLMDESYRTSRVLILGGALVSWLVLSLTSVLSRKLKSKHKNKKLLIVATQERADNIKSQLALSKADTEVIGVVFPQNGAHSKSYLNNISKLGELSKVLKVDEVIFSTEDMTTKDIMKTMINLDTKLSFKIAGDESLSILGSKSSNTAGEIYDVDLHYNLNSEYHIHIKRVLDVLVSILGIVLFPILIVINKFRVLAVLQSLFQTLVGVKTWVGYVGVTKDFQNYPILREGIFHNTVATNANARETNRRYAKNHNIWIDLEVILKNIHNIK